MKKRLFRISIIWTLVFMLIWTSLNTVSASAIPTSKVLSIPYIDQVYVQNKIQSQDSTWKDPIWYLCGPSSLNMVLASFGLANTDVSTTKTIAQNILVNPKTSAGRYTNWTKIPTYLQTKFKINSQFKQTKLTFAEIKKNIDAGHPILAGVSFTLPPDIQGNKSVGHIVAIIGYIDPDIVIVNDPFGNKIVPKIVNKVTYYNWNTRNLPPTSKPKSNGNQVEYKYSELSKILSNKWLSLISIPKKSTLIHTSTVTSTLTSTLPVTEIRTQTSTQTSTLVTTFTPTSTQSVTLSLTPTSTLTQTPTITPSITTTIISLPITQTDTPTLISTPTHTQTSTLVITSTGTPILTSTITSTTTKTPTPTIPTPMVLAPSLSPVYSATCGFPPSYWWKNPNGYKGFSGTDMFLTMNATLSSQSTNVASYHINVPLTGQYKLEAYVAYHPSIIWPCTSASIYGDTSKANYQVHHSIGTTTVVVDQLPLNNAWASLGIFRFNAGTAGSVVLPDITGETFSARFVSVNVIRVTWVGP
jgi:hypothetical protein